MPPEAAGWDKTALVHYWRVQQHKLVHFASGLHVRLGTMPQISTLNDTVLKLMNNEVLGG